MAEKKRLTKRSCEAVAIPAAGRAVVNDADCVGLSIVVTPTGTRTFYLTRRIEGRPRRIRIGAYPETTPEAARKIAAGMVGDIVSGRNPADERRRRRAGRSEDPTLGELLEHVMESHWKPHAKSWRWMKGVLDSHTPKAWLARRISSISRVDIIDRHRAIGTKSPTAANRWRSLIGKAYAVAAFDMGFTGMNPVVGIQKFKESPRRRFVQPEEMPRLQAVLDNWHDQLTVDFFRLALATGQRKTALMRMRFADIDDRRGIWRVPAADSKNGEELAIPLTTAALELIRQRRREVEGPYVFPGRGKPHVKDIRKRIARLLKAAGLEDVTTHDIRRTTASWLGDAGVAGVVIRDTLGQKQLASTDVYVHSRLDSVRAGLEHVDKAMRGAE